MPARPPAQRVHHLRVIPNLLQLFHLHLPLPCQSDPPGVRVVAVALSGYEHWIEMLYFIYNLIWLSCMHVVVCMYIIIYIYAPHSLMCPVHRMILTSYDIDWLITVNSTNCGTFTLCGRASTRTSAWTCGHFSVTWSKNYSFFGNFFFSNVPTAPHWHTYWNSSAKPWSCCKQQTAGPKLGYWKQRWKRCGHKATTWPG